MNRFLHHRVTVVVCALFAVISLVQTWNYGQAKPGYDFYQFWAVSQKISRGANTNLYAEESRRALGAEFLARARESNSGRFQAAAVDRDVLEVYSTPLLYLMFKPLSSLTYDRAYTLYQLACMACTVFAVLMLARLLGFPIALSLAALGCLILIFDPYRSDLRVGNVNQIQLALLSLSLWCQSARRSRGRWFAGGLILGILILFKPNLVFVVVMLGAARLIQRRFARGAAELGGLAAAAIGVAILSFAATGTLRNWLDWWRAGTSMPASVITMALGNYSLMQVLSRLVGDGAARLLAVALAALAVGCVWRGHRRSGAGQGLPGPEADLEDVLLISVGCLLYLLSAPLVWLHYYLLTVPIGLCLARPASSPSPRSEHGSAWAVRGLAVAAMALIALNPLHCVVKFQAGPWVAVSLIGGTAVVFLLALRELWLGPRLVSGRYGFPASTGIDGAASTRPLDRGSKAEAPR